jgi:hypothetical protein
VIIHALEAIFSHLPQCRLIQAARAAILKPPDPRHLHRRFVFAPQVAGKMIRNSSKKRTSQSLFIYEQKQNLLSLLNAAASAALRGLTLPLSSSNTDNE